jgi:LPS O-antigen subunit length determinant protein (WzzB/FepE family)
MTEKAPSPPPQSDQAQSSHKTLEVNEIQLVDLLEILVKKKLLIIFPFFISTLASIFYIYTIQPLYIATIGVLAPDEHRLASYFPKSLTPILPGMVTNKASELKEEVRNNTLFYEFLTTIQSSQLQEKTLLESDFLKRFNGINNSGSNEIKILSHSIHNSISIRNPKKIRPSASKPSFNRATYIDMVGTKPEPMSDYLNTLVELANNEILSKARLRVSQGIKSRIDSHSERLDFLRSRQKSKQLNKIKKLKKNLEIAKELGIVENNFSNLTSNMSISFMLDQKQQSLINHNDEQQMPIWYLYGQRALEKELEMMSRYPFTLSEYFDEVLEFSSKIASLSRIDLSTINFEAVIISQPSITTKKKTNKPRTVIIAGIIGLFVGLILVLISHLMDLLRKRNTPSLTHDL